MRESFSMVQNILFVGYIKVLPAHQWENIVEKLWETMQLFFVLEGTKTWVNNGVCSVVL